MTLGELHDKLMELRAAEDQVDDAIRSVNFGGNPDTVRRKEQWLEHTKEVLEAVRAQTV